jgi:hypothetical protein
MSAQSKKTKLSNLIKYHQNEAARIQSELDNLGPGFSKNGPVRTILRNRIFQEKRRAADLQTIGRIKEYGKKFLIFLLTFQNWFYHGWK